MARTEHLLPHKPAHHSKTAFWRATALFTNMRTGQTVLRIKDFEGENALPQVDQWHNSQRKEAEDFNNSLFAVNRRIFVKFQQNCFEIWG